MINPRRAGSWLIGLLVMVLAPTALATSPRIATIDWTLAETLAAIGAPAQGVAQVPAYHAWVREPTLPDTTLDLGLRSQPNLEQLASLDPDRILISPMFANLASRLEQIAPVETIPLHRAGRDTWDELYELTRTLGRVAERSDAAEHLIRDTEARITALSRKVKNHPPLLLIQFMDSRHVRVFGTNSLFQAVLERLGLENAWIESTNRWGFSLVGIEALSGHGGRLVVMEPYPAGVEQALDRSGLWHHLMQESQGDPLILPPVWAFGALPSAERFAELLVHALKDEDAP